MDQPEMSTTVGEQGRKKRARDVVVRIREIFCNSWIWIKFWGLVRRIKVTFNGLLSLLILLAMILVVCETFEYKDSVSVEPISVPKKLTEIGYTPNVAEQRLIASMHNELARTSDLMEGGGSIKSQDDLMESGGSIESPKDVMESVELEESNVDFVVPAAGLSIKSTAAYLASFLGLNAHVVTGEILYDEPQGHISLRLRVNKKNVATVSEAFEEEATDFQGRKKSIFDQLFSNGAHEVLEALSPRYLSQRYSQYISNAKLDLRAQKEYRSKVEKKIKFILHDENADTEKKIQAINFQGKLCYNDGQVNMIIEKYPMVIEPDDKIAPAYCNCGLALSKEGDYAGAIEKFQKATELKPDYALAYYSWGLVLSKKGDYADAIEKYQKTTELDPTKEALAYHNWGLALAKSDKSKNPLETVQLDDQQKSSIYIGWGVGLFEKGEYDSVIEKYKKATELDPKNALAYYNWGLALSREGKYAGAVEKYDKATRYDSNLKPNYALAYHNWGLALAKSDKSENPLETVKLDDQQKSSIYIGWGVGLFEKGEYASAIEKYQKTTELDPKNALAYHNWGLALAKSDKSENPLETVKLDDQQKSSIYIGWGVGLFEKGEYASAIEKYQKATELDPTKEALAYYNGGLALAKSDKSENPLETVQLDDQQKSSIYIGWGVGLFEKADYASAIEKYRKASKLAPSDALVYYNWGLALSKKGDYADAIEKYDKATRYDFTLQPEYATVYYNWGFKLSQEGKCDDAFKKYKKVTEFDDKFSQPYLEGMCRRSK